MRKHERVHDENYTPVDQEVSNAKAPVGLQVKRERPVLLVLLVYQVVLVLMDLLVQLDLLANVVFLDQWGLKVTLVFLASLVPLAHPVSQAWMDNLDPLVFPDVLDVMEQKEILVLPDLKVSLGLEELPVPLEISEQRESPEV